MSPIDLSALLVGPVPDCRVQPRAAQISARGSPESHVFDVGCHAAVLSRSIGRIRGRHCEGGTAGWGPLVAREESSAQ